MEEEGRGGARNGHTHDATTSLTVQLDWDLAKVVHVGPQGFLLRSIFCAFVRKQTKAVILF